MPFIEQGRRQPMLDGTLVDPKPGDLCFKYYKRMVDIWTKEPRWTTAHTIYKDFCFAVSNTILNSLDERVALGLAWQVFFQLYVVPYELAMREKNGDVI